jgi:hypothetical protein
MLKIILIQALLLSPAYLYSHGGVVLEDDICLIKMGFLTAHFTIYQPETRNNEEFCEAIPDAAASIFILDYTHNALSSMPIEFRIIRDQNNLGAFTKMEDVEAIDNIDAATVFYRNSKATNASNLIINHSFDEKGWYVGIVKVLNPETGKIYATIFPFEVGKDYNYLMLFLLLAICLQITYCRLQKRNNSHD